MRACAAAALTTLALLVCAPGAGASHTSEVLFTGSGFYCCDVTAGDQGYGSLGDLSISYDYAAGIPSGSYSLYFLPDFRVTLRAPHGERYESHSVGVGPTGIVCDNDVASWGDLGCLWVDGKGIALGEAVVAAVDPESCLGS